MMIPRRAFRPAFRRVPAAFTCLLPLLRLLAAGAGSGCASRDGGADRPDDPGPDALAETPSPPAAAPDSADPDDRSAPGDDANPTTGDEATADSGVVELPPIEPEPVPMGRSLAARLLAAFADAPRIGIELHRVVIDRRFDAMGTSLLRASDPARPHAGLPPAVVESLRDNGLRIRAVPLRDLADFVAGLPAEPVLNSTWLDLAPSWQPVATGPAVRGMHVLLVDGERVEFVGAGQLRLVMRAYPRRTETGPRIRIEALTQWLEPDFRSLLDLESAVPATRPDPADELVFESAAFALEADGRHAFIITTAEPDEVWTTEAAVDAESPSAPAEAADGGTADAASGRDEDGGTAEPTVGAVIAGPEPADPVRTIGEELLASSNLEKRLVLILVPRLPRPADGGGP